jgi:hypothetical protein
LIRADSGAHVYHYGWVRPPAVMLDKQEAALRLYESEGQKAAVPEYARLNPTQPYAQLGHLRRFIGPHPKLMQSAARTQDWAFDGGIEHQPRRWQRYMSIVVAYPRDSMRVFVSRLLLTWNTYVPYPKLR